MDREDKTLSPSGAFNQIFFQSETMSIHDIDIEDIVLHVG